MRSWVVALGLVGCASDVVLPAYRCDVTIGEITPTSGSPGEPIAVTGTPFTTTWDTAIYVGGTRAVVDDVGRYKCEECDACFDAHEEECPARTCADCDACDVICTVCIERASFVVPDVAAGETDVRVLNSHGESNPIPFVVVAKPVDTGDSGAETGDSAAETGDSAPPESGDSGK